MNIRFAQETDWDLILQVIETAFSDGESRDIMNLVKGLSIETINPPIVSLVAEVDNQLIGYISFSPVSTKPRPSIFGYIVSPLAVSPEHQRQGVGYNLVKSGIDMLIREHVDVLLVYGDPDYYGRFGFTEEIGNSFIPPYPLQYPFGWRGMNLSGKAMPEQPIRIACISALSKPSLW